MVVTSALFCMMQENTAQTNSGNETALFGDGGLSSSDCDIDVSIVEFRINN